MKRVRYTEAKGLYMEEDTISRPLGPQEVRVQTAYTSICGFDMMTVRREVTQGQDGSLGHEASGIVVEVGAQVDPQFAVPGDRVALEFHVPCGVCPLCRDGESAYCINPIGYLDYLSDTICVHQTQVHRLPENVTLQQACLTVPVMMGMRCIEQAHLRPGGDLLILGAGSMGLTILKLARRHPLGKIVVVEPVQRKRQLAQQFGADVVLDPNHGSLLAQCMQESNGRGFRSVVEASGSPKSARLAFQLLTRGGHLVYFALYGLHFELNTNQFQLYWKDASFHGVGVPSHTFPAALRLLPQLRMEEIITGLYPFDRALEAFEEKALGHHAKVMLYCPPHGGKK